MIIKVGTCVVCSKDLFASPGQIVRFHGECRIEGKRRYGKSTGVKQFDVNEFGKLTPVSIPAVDVIVK